MFEDIRAVFCLSAVLVPISPAFCHIRPVPLANSNTALRMSLPWLLKRSGCLQWRSVTYLCTHFWSSLDDILYSISEMNASLRLSSFSISFFFFKTKLLFQNTLAKVIIISLLWIREELLTMELIYQRQLKCLFWGRGNDLLLKWLVFLPVYCKLPESRTVAHVPLPRPRWQLSQLSCTLTAQDQQ